MHGVKRDLEHIEEIADACHNILPQSSMGPRTHILGTVYFLTPAVIAQLLIGTKVSENYTTGMFLQFTKSKNYERLTLFFSRDC